MSGLQRSVGASIRARRKAQGLTQAALAESASVSVELVSRVERGRCLPSVPTLVAFARALGCTPNDLTGFERPKPYREVDQLVAVIESLPRGRRREIQRIAEALARYERQG